MNQSNSCLLLSASSIAASPVGAAHCYAFNCRCHWHDRFIMTMAIVAVAAVVVTVLLLLLLMMIICCYSTDESKPPQPSSVPAVIRVHLLLSLLLLSSFILSLILQNTVASLASSVHHPPTLPPLSPLPEVTIRGSCAPPALTFTRGGDAASAHIWPEAPGGQWGALQLLRAAGLQSEGRTDGRMD